MRSIVPMSVALIAGGLALASCNEKPNAYKTYRGDEGYERIASMPNDSAKLRLLGEYIREFVGGPVCTRPNQCRVVTFGAKACGGWTDYVIYSTATTDSIALAELAGEFTRLKIELIPKYWPISDCEILPRPEVGCVDGRCGIVPR